MLNKNTIPIKIIPYNLKNKPFVDPTTFLPIGGRQYYYSYTIVLITYALV